MEPSTTWHPGGWNWFGVRTLHVIASRGRPHATDKDYCRTARLFEERIVLVWARNFDAAIRKGVAEARRYARSYRHRNPYGQPVRARYPGDDDVSCFDEAPGNLVEVWSATELETGRVTGRELKKRHLGYRNVARHRGSARTSTT